MKFIAKMFQSKELELNLTIKPHSQRDKSGKVREDSTLVVQHLSKTGSSYLIFDPSIYFELRSRSFEGRNSATITQPLFRRFTAMVRNSYQSLAADKLYHEDGKDLFLDANRAQALARKMSLYRNSLTVQPCLVNYYGNVERGVSFTLDGDSIGTIAHMDLLQMIDTLEHFEPSTFSMLAAMIDEMESMNCRLDTIEDLLRQINTKLDGATSPSKKEDRAPVLSMPGSWAVADVGPW